MFKIGETVIHKHDVCTITDINKNYRDGEDYYVLKPVGDTSLIIRTPIDNPLGLMRKIITKADAEALIRQIPQIEVVELDSKMLANEYKKLLNQGSHESLVKIIKTAYSRNEERARNKQNSSENDKVYFRLAEKILYSELATTLDLTPEEVRDYISKSVNQASLSADKITLASNNT